MDSFLSTIAESMLDDFNAHLTDDTMEEGLCMLTGLQSSYEVLEESLQEVEL